MTKINPLLRENMVTSLNPAQNASTSNDALSVWLRNNRGDKQVIENYEYTTSSGNKYTGQLTIYKNGKCIFSSTMKQGIPFVLVFESKKDLKNHKESKQINYPNDNNKRRVMVYQYNVLGKKSGCKTYNADNKLINNIKFNNSGKVAENTIYNPETGEVKNVVKYKYDNKNHKEIRQVFDKDKNLLSTTTIVYEDDNKTMLSSETVDKDGKTKSKTEYENGKFLRETRYLDNNVKTVEERVDDKINNKVTYTDGEVTAEETIWAETRAVKDRWELVNGEKVHTISSDLDLNFAPSKQAKEGDCYLIATINSILGAEGGNDLLKSLVNVSEKSGKKVYKVKLPGAILAREGLKNDKRVDANKVYITGEYEFTEDELINKYLPKAGIKYSIGNANVILLEAAFEKYREEVRKTLKENNIQGNILGVAGLNGGNNQDDTLYGGQGYDAAYILTGQPSKLYRNNSASAVSLEEMQDGRLVVVPQISAELSKGAPSEIDGDVLTSASELDKLIEEIREDYKDGHIDRITTAAFRTVNKDGKKGGHQLSIVGIEGDNIILKNPWHPDKTVSMSIADFKKAVFHLCVTSSTVSEMSKPQNPEAQEEFVPPQSNNSHTEAIQTNENSTYKVKIKKGTSYTLFIRQELIKQNITNPTKEQITKAKRQFEAANPQTDNSQAYVHVYNSNAHPERKGNRYLIADLEYNVPKFDV